MPFERDSADFTFDRSPYPPLRWANHSREKPEREIALQSLKVLLAHINQSGFEMILRGLLTERSVLVLGSRRCDVADVILALHLVVDPLRWICPSMSLMPHTMLDLFGQPTAFLYGLAGLAVTPPENAVIVDLNKKTVKTSLKLLDLPDIETRDGAKLEFKKTLKAHWKASSPDEAAPLIAADVAAYLAKLLAPVPRSIVTNMTSMDALSSTFVPELYLAQFRQEHRPFVQAVAETQMMQFYVQKICKDRSDNFRTAEQPK